MPIALTGTYRGEKPANVNEKVRTVTLPKQGNITFSADLLVLLRERKGLSHEHVLVCRSLFNVKGRFYSLKFL